jgi:hypothetical protein
MSAPATDDVFDVERFVNDSTWPPSVEDSEQVDVCLAVRGARSGPGEPFAGGGRVSGARCEPRLPKETNMKKKSVTTQTTETANMDEAPTVAVATERPPAPDHSTLEEVIAYLREATTDALNEAVISLHKLESGDEDLDEEQMGHIDDLKSAHLEVRAYLETAVCELRQIAREASGDLAKEAVQ